jgi:hypothetical protein
MQIDRTTSKQMNATDNAQSRDNAGAINPRAVVNGTRWQGGRRELARSAAARCPSQLTTDDRQMTTTQSNNDARVLDDAESLRWKIIGMLPTLRRVESLHAVLLTVRGAGMAELTSPEPDGKGQWITIEKAARRCGKSVGHLRRLGKQLAGIGMARLIHGGGKRSRYLIHVDALAQVRK